MGAKPSAPASASEESVKLLRNAPKIQGPSLNGNKEPFNEGPFTKGPFNKEPCNEAPSISHWSWSGPSYAFRRCRPRYCNVLDGFAPEALPVLSALADEFVVMDRFFCSVPGPPSAPRLRFALGKLRSSLRAARPSSIWRVVRPLELTAAAAAYQPTGAACTLAD